MTCELWKYRIYLYVACELWKVWRMNENGDKVWNDVEMYITATRVGHDVLSPSLVDGTIDQV